MSLGGGSDGPVDDFFNWGWYLQQEGKNFFDGGIRQCNVGLTYGKNVALRCECSMPAAN